MMKFLDKLWQRATLLIIVILTAVIVGLSITLVNSNAVNHKKVINEVTLKESLLPISEMSTYEYEYTTLAKYEDKIDFYGVTIPFTTTKFFVTFDGIIKAGFNFEQLEIQMNETEIFITLPELEIVSHKIDYDSLEVIDESYSIFNPIKITDYNAFYKDHAMQMEQKAIDAGLLNKAKDNAIIILKGFVESLVGEDYTVTVK